MKTAKEMFEELGYKVAVSNEDVLMYICLDDFIYFYLKDQGEVNKNKGYGAFQDNYKDGNYTKRQKTISIKLHKAIHQQMKEFGWLE